MNTQKNDIQLYTNSERLPVGQEAKDVFSWGNELGKCKYYQKLGTAGVISIILTARELGLPPMACLNGGLYQIDGRVSISAQMMNALILKAGHRVDILEFSEKRCTIRFKRADREAHTDYSYTVEDASKAGYLKKDNWINHLKDMLYCRCLSGGARKIMPDAIMGCYIHGELQNGEMPGNQEVPEISENFKVIEEKNEEVYEKSFDSKEECITKEEEMELYEAVGENESLKANIEKYILSAHKCKISEMPRSVFTKILSRVKENYKKAQGE